MQFEEGEPDFNIKDGKGWPLSAEAAEHMSKNRVRCNSCQQNFCVTCKMTPYHLGKNCEQAKISGCRFCGDEFKESVHPEPVFNNVCEKKEC